MSKKHHNQKDMNGNQEQQYNEQQDDQTTEENLESGHPETNEAGKEEVPGENQASSEEEAAMEEEAFQKESGKSELEQKQEEYQELHDKYLRLYSEFENFRRRSRKEVSDAKDKGRSEFVLAILPVLDDFERAMNSIKENQDENTEQDEVSKGVELIFNKFKSTLNDQGLQEMEVVGDEFDPEYHEAMTKMQAPSEEQKGKIIEEVQKGYLFNDRIVRHAKVVVGE